MVVKSPKRVGEARIAEELRYLRENPHEAELREIFSLARVEYGRIDYGVVDGRIQTCNGTALEMLRQRADEVIGRTPAEAWQDEERGKLVPLFAGTGDGSQAWRQLRIIAGNSARYSASCASRSPPRARSSNPSLTPSRSIIPLDAWARPIR